MGYLEIALTHTDQDRAEYDALLQGCASADRLERERSRNALRKFIARHGEEACDQMYVELLGDNVPPGFKPSHGKRTI